MNRRVFATSGLTMATAPRFLQAQTPEASPVANTSKRRVIAGSESATEGDLESDRLFGEWIGSGNKALYLPIASADDEARTPLKADRIWNTISQAGVASMDTWLHQDIDAEGFDPDLSDYSGVYIGDGNPRNLLTTLHGSGLFHALVEAADAGAVLYGTSAGSMVLGANAILPISPNDTEQSGMSPEETDGLDVIRSTDGSGLILVPHFSGLRPEVWEPVAEATGYKVALIQDGSGLTLNRGELEEYGSDPVHWIG